MGIEEGVIRGQQKLVFVWEREYFMLERKGPFCTPLNFSLPYFSSCFMGGREREREGEGEGERGDGEKRRGRERERERKRVRGGREMYTCSRSYTYTRESLASV